ncbi:hypothetical protein L1987_24675 [Smallanthus sonchifolius]|uniref:Uncharacterized protein n=1 Tax=Smallanthus sonchifolius TaxID=185202 RepID=A0ACB9ILP2_9ASTR|nr:hypothetical protein L1987_24675 [Smallanthus sonchifolius]
MNRDLSCRTFSGSTVFHPPQETRTPPVLPIVVAYLVPTHHHLISPFCVYHSADKHKHQRRGFKGFTISAPRRMAVKAMKKMEDPLSRVQFDGVAP